MCMSMIWDEKIFGLICNNKIEIFCLVDLKYIW